MINKRSNFYRMLESSFRLLLRVVRGFSRNQGLLLAGAVAFHTLLSIFPLSIIALIVLTQFVEEGQLILTLTTYLEMSLLSSVSRSSRLFSCLGLR